jgi:hypothetical protein
MQVSDQSYISSYTFLRSEHTLPLQRRHAWRCGRRREQRTPSPPPPTKPPSLFPAPCAHTATRLLRLLRFSVRKFCALCIGLTNLAKTFRWCKIPTPNRDARSMSGKQKSTCKQERKEKLGPSSSYFTESSESISTDISQGRSWIATAIC